MGARQDALVVDSRRITLGKIAGVYGVKGWIKIHSQTRPIENLLKYRTWWIAKGAGFEAKLLNGNVHANGIIAHISGVDGQPMTDRDVAAGLLGAEIQVERSAFPELPEGQYYWVDLIGLNVLNEQGEALGEVTDVTSNGAQDVLVLQQGEVERLIPFINGPIVKSVDLAAKRIVCDWQLDY